MSARDFQRAKYYKAEQVCWDCEEGGVKKNFGSVVNTQAVCDSISFSKAFKELFGFTMDFTIKDGRGRKNGAYFRSSYYGAPEHVIKLPRFSRFLLYLVHEITHGIVRELYGYDNIASHGAEFAAIMVVMSHEFISPNVANVLEDSFEKSGVRVSL